MTSFLRLGVTEEDQALADAVAKFAQAEIAPRAQELDEQEASVTCHVPQLAELGVMGLNLPEELGGPGVTPTAMLMALVARVPRDRDAGDLFHRTDVGADPRTKPETRPSCRERAIDRVGRRIRRFCRARGDADDRQLIGLHRHELAIGLGRAAEDTKDQ